MRAVVVSEFGDYHKADVIETPRPTPGPDEVLIDVKAAPANYVDLVVISGKYQFSPPLPFTPGKGPVGVVIETGDNVLRLKKGDRIIAMAESGGYAQFAVAPAKDCYILPNAITDSQAAAMSLAYDTAWMALRDRARVAPDETVLVLGATGAVGRAALQLARAMGARTIGAVATPARFDSAKQAGAHGVVDLSLANLRDALREQVLAQTDGKGADVILDMLGGDYFDAGLRALAWRGRLVVIGFAAGRIPVVKVNYLMVKNIEVSGLQISDYRKRRPDLMADCYREIFAFFEQGLLDPGPIRELPLDQFRTGLELIERRQANGRVVLLPH